MEGKKNDRKVKESCLYQFPLVHLNACDLFLVSFPSSFFLLVGVWCYTNISQLREAEHSPYPCLPWRCAPTSAPRATACSEHHSDTAMVDLSSPQRNLDPTMPETVTDINISTPLRIVKKDISLSIMLFSSHKYFWVTVYHKIIIIINLMWYLA